MASAEACFFTNALEPKATLFVLVDHKTQPSSLRAIARVAAGQAPRNMQKLANDHFGHDPNAGHWGHVGDLEQVEHLDDLLAIFYGQPE